MSLLLFYGVSVVDVSSSDTGSGVETSSLAADISSSDTAASSDTGIVAASVADADAGVGTEESSISAVLVNADASISVDTESIIAYISSDDTGTSSETETLIASLTDDDTVTSTDTGNLVIPVASADSGASVETGTIDAALSSSDTSTGVESATLSASLSDADTGSGTDTGSLTVALTGADTGLASDTGSVVAALASSDTGFSTDSGFIAASLDDDDTATLVESEQIDQLIDDGDSANAIETETLLATLADADTGSAVEVTNIAATVTSTDIGTAIEASIVDAALSDDDTAAGVESDPFLLAVLPPTVFEMPSLVEILRQRSVHVDGRLNVGWYPLHSPENAGQFWSRFDLQFVKPGSNALPPVMSGVIQDRIGIMFADTWVANLLKAGDRVHILSGPITGTFDVRNIPEQALGYESAHHLEVSVVEVSQRPEGSYAIPDVYVPSYIRHLYASRVEVLRRHVNSRTAGSASEVWRKIEEIPDMMLDTVGEMMCRLDLQFIRTGKDMPLPAYAGRAADRTGTLFFDVNSNVKAGDRVRCIDGDVEGTFEIKAIPDIVPDLYGVNHIECQVVEVAQSMLRVTTS